MSVPWRVVTNGQRATASCQHLPGEQGADGVRNGVVNMEKVEIAELGDLGHTRGQGPDRMGEIQKAG